jgi:signal transduction histidine kinase
VSSDRPTSPRAPARVEEREAAVPAALLAKLKLLPLRERELSTLRQLHQHQVRWIEGAQELMVRLANASTIPQAVHALVNSLVQEFGFDLSGASTPAMLLAGDPLEQLTSVDHSFIEAVIQQTRQSRVLVISEGASFRGERTLAWLMAGLASTSDMANEPIVIVGRTHRTAPYYPTPREQEAGLYRHLVSTVAQVFRSIALQATHNLELERKVAVRTAALHEAQSRVVELEKQKTAEQMAGGFAHEMRNALSGAKLLIEKGMGDGRKDGLSVVDSTAGELKALFLLARAKLDADELNQFRRGLQEVARNERLISDTLVSVNRSVERALSITSLIMEYSRIGYSRPGEDLVDLAAVVHGVLAESDERFKEHGIVVAVHVDGDVDCRLVGNDAHFYSIVENLVVNAMDALSEVDDDRQRSLTVSLRSSKESVVCRVTDNANGIPDEVRSRIFEPFFSTKPQTGTGLGLGMVQKLVALYDGGIDVESQAGHGTSFVVTLGRTGDTGGREKSRAASAMDHAIASELRGARVIG